MRLFTAVLPDYRCRELMYAAMTELKQSAQSGTFTHKENIHLTLNFIGETENVDGARRALDSIENRKFAVSAGNFGKFEKKGGDIYWMGFRTSEDLLSLQSKLRSALVDEGFQLENRRYTPHITLGRKVVMDPTFDIRTLPGTMPRQIKMEVSKISLMKSERIDGKLIYTEIHKRDLY